jgi:hypothetical protein
VATWTGFVYVAFVIDVYARPIVGWRVPRSAHAGFVLVSVRIDEADHGFHRRSSSAWAKCARSAAAAG